MTFDKQVENPRLIGAIEVMKNAPTVEHKQDFIGEMLKAEFMTPVIVTPDPVQSEDGRWQVPESPQFQFPTVVNKAGDKQFFLAFTDKEEMDKWEPTRGMHTYACTYEDFFIMLLKRNETPSNVPVSGFVINPMGCNLIVDKDMMINLFVRKRPPKKQF